MAVLDQNLTTQLSQLLTKVVQPIELVASLDGSSPKSGEMLDLLNEVAALSDNVSVRTDGDDERRPSFSIERPGSDISVRFAGIPLGHEFSSLVLALVQVGGNPVKEDEEVMAAVRGLEGPLEFTTYMSLSCQNCPAVVQALNAMAVLNPEVKHVAVEGSVFQDEVREKNILSVPQVFLNGEPFATGRMEMADFVAKLDQAGSRERAAQRLNDREAYDVLVVGQGPAGSAAAIYTARKGLRTGLVGERFGGQVLDTMAIENFVSVPQTEGPKFAAALEDHVRRYDVDVVKNQQATALVPATEPGGHHVVRFGDAELRASTVVLATGARWRLMGVPGEEEYRNKGVTFCPHCDGPLFKGKRIAVVGGGNSGVEAAIDLAGVVDHVTVVEFMDSLKADGVLQKALADLPNVDVVLNAQTTEVVGDGAQVTGLRYIDRTSGGEHQLDLAGIFVQIGLLPNTEWLRDSDIELSARGEIVVDGRGVTSLPGVFGAGDCTTEPYKQIVVAQGGGATAALSAFDHLVRSRAQASA